MKTKYFAAILAVLLILFAIATVLLFSPRPSADYVEIRSDGTLLRTLPLNVDDEFTVSLPDGSFNTIVVKDGKIAVTAASCPDHYCMARGFCSSGAQIVCLPNRLVITFLAENEADIAVG